MIKAKKTANEDSASFAAFQALEITEMLLMSEYSYEISFGTRHKQQDYDLFHELVGSEENIDTVLNLHKVYLSLLLTMETELKSLTADIALQSKIGRLLAKLRGKVGED